MSNYLKGARYERKIIEIMRRNGNLVVRSAKSGGLFDVWVLDLKKKKLKLIQVKSGKNGINFEEKKNLLKISKKLPKFCSAEIWFWQKRKGWKIEKVK